VTPEQCIEVRKLLGWSRGDLAEAAEIPVNIAGMFEAHDLHGLASCEIYMRDALVAAGIKFPPISADPRRAPNAVAYMSPEAPLPRPSAKARVEEPKTLTSMWSAVRVFLERTFGG
jgi:hypothetical protein